MWISPNHPRATDAPKDEGQRLATFPRGQNDEMRITRATYNGNPFISFRLWQKGQNGAMWPTKTGCSIRMSEVDELAQVLGGIGTTVTEPEPSPSGPDETRYIPRGRQARPAWNPSDLKVSNTTGQSEFDEFAEVDG